MVWSRSGSAPVWLNGNTLDGLDSLRASRIRVGISWASTGSWSRRSSTGRTVTRQCPSSSGDLLDGDHADGAGAAGAAADGDPGPGPQRLLADPDVERRVRGGAGPGRPGTAPAAGVGAGRRSRRPARPASARRAVRPRRRVRRRRAAAAAPAPAPAGRASRRPWTGARRPGRCPLRGEALGDPVAHRDEEDHVPRVGLHDQGLQPELVRLPGGRRTGPATPRAAGPPRRRGRPR